VKFEEASQRLTTCHEVVPSALVCSNHNLPAETLSSFFRYPTGKGLSMRWYHRHWYAQNITQPLRWCELHSGISLANGFPRGDSIDFGMLKTPLSR
jgi:hypothetical protein